MKTCARQLLKCQSVPTIRRWPWRRLWRSATPLVLGCALAIPSNARGRIGPAAHRSLPIGTLVYVDNKENGRWTVVRITDRGPFIGERIIDVSQVAARALDISGLTSVCLSIRWMPENRPVERK